MRGIKIDVTKNGWLVQPDIASHNLPTIADMQVAETLESLVLIVRQWGIASMRVEEGAMSKRE